MPFPTEEQARVTRDAGALLASKGLLTSVAARDENDVDVEGKELGAYSSETLRSLQQITTHTYAGKGRARLRSIAKALGKRKSVSE